MTDVTGFGLAGHALEMARGSDCAIHIDWASVPCLGDARSLAAKGFVTGASARNHQSYGGSIATPAGFAPEDLALRTDPQTSGGLLVSCAPDAVDDVTAVFARHGFEAVGVIGTVKPAEGAVRLLIG